MMDPVNPRGTFVGANDNAGGVAILMQLAEEIPKNKYRFGIDIVLFDGEEFVFSREQRHFLGSEYFARQYRDKPPAYRYRWGVLLDMISGKESENLSRAKQHVLARHAAAGAGDLEGGGTVGGQGIHPPAKRSRSKTTTFPCTISARFPASTSSISTIPPGTPKATRPTNARR